MADYHPQELDKKWQKSWADSRAFEVSVDPSRPKFYCLEMFAYPSGHAHVGHVRNYIIGDVMARTKRMRGYNVLHPFGWDAFGLPAENAAIKNGIPPEESTRGNIALRRSTRSGRNVGRTRGPSRSPRIPPVPSSTASRCLRTRRATPTSATCATT